MAKLDNLKRIAKEDFNEDSQELVGQLAGVLNPFLEQVYNAFNKGINTDNLTRQILTIDVENNSLGALKIQTQLKHSLANRILGFNVIRAENLTNPATYPTSIPFPSWSINGNIITFHQVTGIQADNKYRLTLEIIS